MSDTNNNLRMPNLDGNQDPGVNPVASVVPAAVVAGSGKMRLMILAGVVAALVVGGGLYYKFGYSVDEDVPPSIDMGGNGFQGMLQAGKDKFLKYEEEDHAAFAALIEENADILNDPVKLRSGVNYVYAYEDVPVGEMIQCIDPAADRVLLAQYDPEREKFVTYPEGPFGVQTETVDEEYVFEAGTGLIIISAKAADAYCVAPASSKSEVGLTGLVGADDTGWYLVAANEDNLGDAVEPFGERVLKAFALNSENKFEKVEDYDYELGGDMAYLVWLKFGEGEAAVEPVDEAAVEPVDEPVVEPVDEPADEPVDEPVVEPVDEPVVEPVDEPVVEPVDEPVVEPVDEPAEEPSLLDAVRSNPEEFKAGTLEAYCSLEPMRILEIESEEAQAYMIGHLLETLRAKGFEIENAAALEALLNELNTDEFRALSDEVNSGAEACIEQLKAGEEPVAPVVDPIAEPADPVYPGIGELTYEELANEDGEKVVRFSWAKVENAQVDRVSYVVGYSIGDSGVMNETDVVQAEGDTVTFDVLVDDAKKVQARVKVLYWEGETVHESEYTPMSMWVGNLVLPGAFSFVR